MDWLVAARNQTKKKLKPMRDVIMAEIKITNIDWLSIKSDGLPENRQRILTFSPAYGENNSMRYRVVDSQFLGLMTEVTHYLYLTAPGE